MHLLSEHRTTLTASTERELERGRASWTATFERELLAYEKDPHAHHLVIDCCGAARVPSRPHWITADSSLSPRRLRFEFSSEPLIRRQDGRFTLHLTARLFHSID